jgi:hypothetical protein
MRQAAGMDGAAGPGRDRGCSEDLRDDPRSTQPTDPHGGGIFTDSREPGGGRRHRSTSDHSGTGHTSPNTRGARGARATDDGRRTRDDRTAAARTRAGRNHAATTAARTRASRDHAATTAARTRASRDHASTTAARTRAGRDHASTAQRRAQHPGLELASQRHRQNQSESGTLMADLTLEKCAARAAINVRAGHAAGPNRATRSC